MPINKKETSTILKLDIPTNIRGSERRDLLDEIGEFIVSEIIQNVSSGFSPLQGINKFKKLSPEYAQYQKNGDTTANLDLNGDMLDSLTFKIVGTNKIKIGIFDPDQAIKSFNHNTGDTIPRRAFIPNKNEQFDKRIMSGVDELIQEVLDGKT